MRASVMILSRAMQARRAETHQTHRRHDKYLKKLIFHWVSLQKSVRNRQVSQVSQVSLVSLFHSCLRRAQLSNAGHQHVHRSRFRATSSAHGSRLTHALFATARFPPSGRTPSSITCRHEVLRS